MKHRPDREELVLYDKVLTLADKQSDAFRKLAEGELGWWKKRWFEIRGHQIKDSLLEIVKHKRNEGTPKTILKKSIEADLMRIRKEKSEIGKTSHSITILKYHTTELP